MTLRFSALNTRQRLFHRQQSAKIAAAFCIILLLAGLSASAKSLQIKGRSRYHKLKSLSSTSDIRAFEASVRPYFEWKVTKKPELFEKSLISDFDLMLIARKWSQLSPEFRKLYLRALAIPGNFVSYESPGGHFEVYYTLIDTIAYSYVRNSSCIAADLVPDSLCPYDTIAATSKNAVNPADTYGFSTADWRLKIIGSNGIPDYVDEVAWALDSAWSMEISRFKFKAPNPFVDDKHESDRYKVVILDLRDSQGELYGMTYPAGKVAGGSGFRSYMEIRHDWSNPIWGEYNKKPLDAAHITCAHEFFHAVQYSMGHNDYPSYIDFFPLAWLEASAVLMEELAFGHVNDYLQYLTGWDGYFGDPSLGVLLDFSGLYVYANSIVAMYLYYRGLKSPSISFINTTFANNQQTPIQWAANLESTSKSTGTTWPVLLNRFHTDSFFTGLRADTTIFLPDAALQPQWIYELDSLDALNGITKNVKPYGMQMFAHGRGKQYSDTLYIQFAPCATAGAQKWAAKIILKDTANTYSLRAFNPNIFTADTIANWAAYNEAIVVVSNGDTGNARSASVHFSEYFLENLNVSESFDCFPNPVQISSHGYLRVYGKNVKEIAIYSIDGSLIAYADVFLKPDNPGITSSSRGFEWQLRNKYGKQVLPGTYIALISYKNISENKLMRRRRSILVLP